MKSPKGWWAIDQALGQTPCVCGAIDTWHPHCYFGKTTEQIETGYEKAYATARKYLREQAQSRAKDAIDKAMRGRAA